MGLGHEYHPVRVKTVATSVLGGCMGVFVCAVTQAMAGIERASTECFVQGSEVKCLIPNASATINVLNRICFGRLGRTWLMTLKAWLDSMRSAFYEVCLKFSLIGPD